MPEEAIGDLPEAEVQAIASHCVKVLAKQVEALCSCYKIANPLATAGSSNLSQGDFSKLEAVLENVFQAIANAISDNCLGKIRGTEICKVCRTVVSVNHFSTCSSPSADRCAINMRFYT
jgi:hypothetical protein